MSEESENNDNLLLQRPVFNQKKFEDQFSLNLNKEKKKTGLSHANRAFKSYFKTFNPKNILRLFTIFNLVTEYNFKNYLINDIISGVTGKYSFLFLRLEKEKRKYFCRISNFFYSIEIS